MYQQLPHMHSPIVKGPKSSYMFGLVDIESRLNLRKYGLPLVSHRVTP